MAFHSEEGGARDGQTGGRSDRVDGNRYDDKGCRAGVLGVNMRLIGMAKSGKCRQVERLGCSD